MDHIRPVSAGGVDVMSNLRAVCSECHKIKTQGRRRRRGRSSGGVVLLCGVRGRCRAVGR